MASMKSLVFLTMFFSAALCACREQKPAGSNGEDVAVDNTVTRYTESLHQDVAKAREAADKMNQAVQETQRQIQQAEDSFQP